MEKNQWRLARILNIHKAKDGEYDSASIRLPSGSVVTRSVKQLALLEPCAIELERQWQEQKSVQSLDPEVPLTLIRSPLNLTIPKLRQNRAMVPDGQSMLDIALVTTQICLKARSSMFKISLANDTWAVR